MSSSMRTTTAERAAWTSKIASTTRARRYVALGRRSRNRPPVSVRRKALTLRPSRFECTHTRKTPKSAQIRAANLSGDCHFGNEVARGNLGFYKQHQRCVKRRAALSVATNANCRGSRATQAVDKVFDTCFRDTAPFAWIP